MKNLISHVRTFLTDGRGSLSVEAALIFPMLVWGFAAMYVYWDAFKTQNNNLKAAHTVSDLLSRETAPIDQAYLDGMNRLFEYLTLTNHPTKLRVSVISNKLEADGVTEYLNLEWSHTTNGLPPATDALYLADFVPVMAVGDQVILVETFMAYEPIFSIGIPADIYGNIMAARPRFAPQVLWSSS